MKKTLFSLMLISSASVFSQSVSLAEIPSSVRKMIFSNKKILSIIDSQERRLIARCAVVGTRLMVMGMKNSNESLVFSASIFSEAYRRAENNLVSKNMPKELLSTEYDIALNQVMNQGVNFDKECIPFGQSIVSEIGK